MRTSSLSWLVIWGAMKSLGTAVVINNINGEHNTVSLTDLKSLVSSSIILELSPEEVTDATRAGNDLVLVLRSGQTITIPDFFTNDPKLKNELILKDDDGVLWLGQYQDEFTGFVWQTSSGSSEMGWWLAAAGIAAAAISFGSHDGGSGNKPRESLDTEAPQTPSAVFQNQGREITGKAEPGSTVTVYDKNGSIIAEIQADPVTGEYVIQLPEPLQNGEEVTVTASDKAGNESLPGTVVAPDLTAPNAPSATFDADGDRITGQAEPGSTVTVYDENANVLGSTQADPNTGDYSIDLQSPLADGESVTVTATDDAGNESPGTAVIAPDITAPQVTLDTVSTQDSTPVFSGTVDDPEAVITVTIGSQTYTAVNNQDGTWTLPDNTVSALTDGNHSIVVTATDKAGNSSSITGNVTILPVTLDLTDVPTLSVPQAADGHINADELNSGITVEVGLPGAAKAGDTITLTLTDSTGSSQTYTHVITPSEAGSGNASLVVPGPLADGDYSLSAQISDNAGGRTADSLPVQFEVDSTAPAAPSAQLNQDTGAQDGITADATVNVGNLEPGATWEYSIDGGDSWEQGFGNSFELEDGSYASGDVWVRQIDEAGNTSPSTSLPAVTVDTQSPGGAQGTDKPGLVIADASDGELDAGEVMAGVEALVTLTPGTQAGDLVTLTLTPASGLAQVFTHTVSQSEVDSGDPLVFVLPGNLSEGSYSAQALITDTAGNSSAPSDSVAFFVNYGLDSDSDGETVGILSISDDFGVAGDFITYDNQLLIQGYLDTDDLFGARTFSVEIDDVTYTLGLDPELTVTGGSGRQNWTLDLNSKPALADGTYQVVAKITDENGHFVAATQNVIIDASAPAAPGVSLSQDTGASNSDGITSDGTVIVTGLEPDATWEYSVNGGASWNAGSGSDFILPEGVYGPNQVQVRQTDVAGNTSVEGYLPSVTVDTTSPAGPNQDQVPVVAIAEAQDGVVNAAEMADGLQVQVTLTPDTAEGDQVQVRLTLDDGTSSTVSYTLTAADVLAGQVEITVPAPLADGEYSVSAQIVDPAGQATGWSNAVDFTLDATGPAGASGNDKPTLLIAEANDQIATAAELADGLQVTVILTPGTQVGDTLTVSFDNGVEAPLTLVHTVTQADLDAAGTVELTLNAAMSNGTYTALAVITDAAGNPPAASDSLSFLVDLGTNPDADLDGNTLTFDGFTDDTADADGITADNRLVFNGTVDTHDLDAGRVLSVELDGRTYTLGVDPELTLSGTADPITGMVGWVLDVTGTQLVDANYVVVAQLTAPNGTAVSEQLAVTVDATAPNAPTLALAEDTGHDNSDGITTNPQVNVSGLEQDASWEYSTNGGTSWIPGSGNSFVLSEGNYAAGDILVRQTDVAGNISLEGSMDPVHIDLTSPGGTSGNDRPTLSSPDISANWVNQAAMADGLQVEVGLTPGTAVGDKVELTLQLSGTGTPLVVAYVVQQADIDNGRLATITVTDPLADGAYSVTARIVDEAGSTTQNSLPLAFGLDTSLPTAPGAELLNDTGTNDSDGVTTDGTVVVSSIEPGATWEYSTDGGDNWTPGDSLTNSFVLSEDVYEAGDVQVRQTDAAGNNSPATSLPAITVDRTSPGGSGSTDAPVLNIPEAADGELSPAEITDGISANITLTSGTQAGDWVTLTLTQAGNTPVTFTHQVSAADLSGTAPHSISISLPTQFAEGGYQAVAYISDAAGNRSADSNSVSFNVNLNVDADSDGLSVTISGVSDDTGDVGDFITADNKLVITGTVDIDDLAAGRELHVSINGETFVLGVAGELTLAGAPDPTTGMDTWTLDLSQLPGLNDATYEIKASLVYPGIGESSATQTLVIDSADPLAPQATLKTDSGTAGDGITNDGTVNVTGIEPGASWYYSTDGGSNWTQGTGNSFVLDPGNYPAGQVLVTQTDAAGNESPSTALGAVTVDVSEPGTPALAIADAADSWINLTELNDGVQAVVTLPGDAQIGDLLQLTLTGGAVPITLDKRLDVQDLAGGQVSFILSGMSDATYNASALLTDVAGNSSAPGTPLSFTVDATLPDAPGLALAVAPAPGASFSLDGTVNVTGLEAGGSWSYSVDGGINWVPGSGNSFVLEEGVYPQGAVLVRQTDAAGNVSPSGSLGATTIDTSSPGNADGNGKPTVSVAEATDGWVNAAENADGVQVQVSLTDGTRVGDSLFIVVTPTVSGSPFTHIITPAQFVAQQATVTIPGLSDGTYQITAYIEDAVGNRSLVSDATSINVDITAPDTPILTPQTSATVGTALVSDGLIDISGLEAGNLWQYSTDGGNSWTTLNNETLTLNEGSYAAGSVLVRQQDPAGNYSANGSLPDLTVDLTSPGGADGDDAVTLVIAEAANGWVNATEASDGIQASVGLTVGTRAGDTLTLTIQPSGQSAYTVIHTITQAEVTAGTANVTIPGPFTDGSYSVQAQVSDGLGNQSQPGSVPVFVIDTQAPAAPQLSLQEDTGTADGITANPVVIVAGIEGNASWQYSLDGGANWQAGDASNRIVLPEGSYPAGRILVNQTDAAGNVSSNGALGPVTIDTTAPGGSGNSDVPVVSVPEAVNGVVNAQAMSDGMQVRVELTPGTQAGDSLTLSVLNTDTNTPQNVPAYLVSAADKTAGFVIITLPASLVDASYSLSAVITDRAGSSTQPSTSATVKVDKTAPDTPALTLVEDTVGPDGVLNDGITSNGLISVSGLEDGASWSYSTDGGVSWSTPVQWQTGDSAEFTLPEGNHPQGSILVRQTDEAGNTSLPGQLNGAVTYDGTAPASAPELSIDRIADGWASGDDFTGSGLPVNVKLTPDAKAGDYIQVVFAHDDGSVDGVTETLLHLLTAQDISVGTVQLYVQQPLGQGEHTAVASLIDQAGNTSPDSNTVTFVADTLAPPALTAQWNNVTADDGSLYTADGTVSISGLETGASWRYSTNGGISWTQATPGSTSFVAPEGTYTADSIRVQQVDQAGNQSPISGPGAMEVDTTSPGGQNGTDAPVLLIPEAGDGWLNATELADGIAVDVELTSGTRAGDIILVTFDGNPDDFTYEYVVTAADVLVGESLFSIATTADQRPSDGQYSVQAVIVDPAGNSSAPSNALNVGVDASSPGGTDNTSLPTLVIIGAEDDDLISESEIATAAAQVGLPNGASEGDIVTVVLTPVGQAAITLNSQPLTATDLSNGSVSIQLPNNMLTGDYSAYSYVGDAAGNQSLPSNTVEFGVERQVGAVLVKIDQVTPDGGVSDDWITNTGAITLQGSVTTTDLGLAEDMTLTIGGVDYSDRLVFSGPTGSVITWTLDLSADGLSEGAQAIVASLNFNGSITSDSKNLLIDTSVATPVLTLGRDTGTLDGITADPAVRVSGLEDGASWSYSLDNGASWSTPVVWSAGQPASFNLLPGDYPAGTVQVRQTDIAGNTSAIGSLPAVSLVISAPATPSLTFTEDSNADGVLNATESAANLDGDIDVRVSLGSGTHAGDRLAYSISNGPLTYYTLTADDVSAGYADLTLPGLAEGTQLDLSVQVIDRAGNASGTATGSLRMDTTGPDQASILVQFADGDGYLNAAEQSAATVTGVLDAGVTLIGLVITDSLGNQVTVSPADITVGADHSFSHVQDLSALKDGPLLVTMTVEDADGNTSTRSDSTILLTDIQAAITGISTDTGTEGDWSTSDTTLIISGTTNVGNAGQLEVTVDNVTYVLGIDPELTITGNNWSLNLESKPLLPGNYSVDVVATDVAGNTTGTVSQVVEIAAVVANDDTASVDLGSVAVEVHETLSASDVSVLRLAEANSGTDARTAFTVQADNKGSVAIAIKQTALAAVADAFVVEVYDNLGNLVYSALSANSNLAADVGGLTVLGAVGDDTVVAVIHGLDAGQYNVVVRNDESQLAQLLDTDGSGISLAELGDAGMVIGPENKAILLNAIETGLNGGIGDITLPGIGTLVRGLVETALAGGDSLGVGQLVNVLNDSALLGATGLTGIADEVVGAVADILLSNLLTLLQYTDIDVTLTEYLFSGGFETSGNLITGALDTSGKDLAPDGAVISQVIDANGNPVAIAATGITTVTGQYGVLLISADGQFRYVSKAHPETLGETEQFTYTLSVPGGSSDTAKLTVGITGPSTPVQPADDQARLDLGDLQSQVQAPIVANDVQFVGLLEGSNSQVVGIPITVSPDYKGDVVIEVRQTALASIADAVRIDVLDSQGNVVYSGVTATSQLVGNVAGLGILGVSGDDGLVAKVNGLEAGNYSVVVYQDKNLAAQLLDGLDLTQLGEAGVVLGPENQELVLDAVEQALGGNVLSGTVRSLLEVTLGLVNGLGVGELVGVIGNVLNGLGLSSQLNYVLEIVAENVVANLLTLLQVSDVVVSVTDYRFEGDLTVTGNVMTGLGAGDVDDQLAEGSVLTQVTNADGQQAVVLGSAGNGVQIEGQYGVLTVYEDGRYKYVANGGRDGLGKEDVFTYTVTSGQFNVDGTRVTDTATLAIAIDGVGLAGDSINANVQLIPRTETLTPPPTAVTASWLLATNSSKYSSEFTVAPSTEQDIAVTLSRSSLLGSGEEMVITLQRKVGTSWVAVEVIDTTAVISLLGLGGDGSFQVSDVGPGTYRFQVYASTLSVAGSYSVSFASTVNYLTELVASPDQQPVSGNLLENDVIRQNALGDELPYTLLVEKQGNFVAVTAETTLEGTYGTLTLQADGSYSYVARTDLDLNDFVDPEPEHFTYRVDYGDRTETAELTVNVMAAGYKGLALALDDGSIALVEEGAGALSGYQLIDLRDADSDADSLTLAGEEVLELELESNVLVIQGDAEDTLNLSKAPWVPDATSSTVDGTLYHHYSLSNTQLWVQDGIQVVEAQ